MRIDRILQYIIYGSLGASILVVPFLVTNSMFFPFITGKNIAFRIFTIIAAVAWSLLAIRKREFRPGNSLVFWSLLTLIIIMGVANIFGVDPARSFWSNFERMDGYVTLLHLGLFILVMSSMFRDWSSWKKILNISIAVSMVMAIYTFFQLSGILDINQGGVRIDGTFGNATYLAVYMLFHVFLTLLLYTQHVQLEEPYKKRRKSSWIRWIYIATIVVQSFVLIKTATRGAMLGLFGGLVLVSLLIALFEKENIKFRKYARVSLIVLIFIAGLFFVARDTAIVQNVESFSRLASISLEQKTVRSRIVLWESVALEGFKERPILGWGQEGFGAVFAKYYNPDMFDQEPWFDRSHNIVFDWLLSGGILGFLAYTSLFIVSLYYMWRPESDFGVTEKSILTGLLLGYSFHNLFVFDNVVSYIMFGITLSFIHVRSVSGTRNEEEENRKNKLINSASPFQYVLIILVLLVASTSIYWFSIRPAKAASSLISALIPQETLEKNLDFYNKAYSYGKLGDREIALQLFQITNSVVANADVSDNDKQAFVLRAVEIGKEISEKGDESARHDLFFGIFLMQIGFFDDSLKYLELSLNYSPNKQQILSTLAQYYFTIGDIEHGMQNLRLSYELAPQFTQLATSYVNGLIRTGDLELADKILVESFGSVNVANIDVINAYIDTGNVVRARDSLIKYISINENEVNAYIALIRILISLGDVDVAEQYMDVVRKLDPEALNQI